MSHSHLAIQSDEMTPCIVTVCAGPEPLSLRIVWQHGGESVVDVSHFVGAFRVYAPLANDRGLFARTRVGELGTDVVWTDEIDMATVSLLRLPTLGAPPPG